MGIKLKKDKVIKEVKTDDSRQEKGSGFGAWVISFLGVSLLAFSILLGVYAASQCHSFNGMMQMLRINDTKEQNLFYEQMLDYFDLLTAGIIGDEGKIYINENEYWITDEGISFPVVINSPKGHWYYYYDQEAPIVFYQLIEENSVTQDFVVDDRFLAADTYSTEKKETAQDSFSLTDEQKKELIYKTISERLNDEGINLKYYAQNSDGTILSNIDINQTYNNEYGRMMLPNGYDFCLYFDGEHLTAYYAKSENDAAQEARDTLQTDVVTSPIYQRLIDNYQMGSSYFLQYPELSQTKVVLFAATDFIENYNGFSQLYHVQDEILSIRIMLFATAVLWGFSLILLALAFFKRQDRRRFERRIVAILTHIWVEIKVVLIFIAGFSVIGLFVTVIETYNMASLDTVLFCSVLWILAVWALYLLLWEWRTNGSRKYFANNILHAYFNLIRSKESLMPFQEKLLSRFYTLLATEIFLLLVAIVTCITVIIPLIAIGVGIYLLMRYIRQYKELIEDIGKIYRQIELIKSGDMTTELHLSPDADLFPAAQALNTIQEGVNIATEERMRSERMKIDLVTNVSHDLKTPLTSIISYVDLLEQEELPDAARDYVGILRTKSNRLKVLINDLFDLAKATSANLEVNPERLDFTKLLKQICAAMGEDIEYSGLTFKTNIAQGPIYIMSDGNKMHRVFENLLTNAMKYSLEGSRVFLELTSDGKTATTVIKNIAKYEMNFDAETILARFVRGDKARSTEGSGLGLAIAKSYTEACGGKLSLAIDGDLFKVAVTFDVLPPEEPIIAEEIVLPSDSLALNENHNQNK